MKRYAIIAAVVAALGALSTVSAFAQTDVKAKAKAETKAVKDKASCCTDKASTASADKKECDDAMACCADGKEGHGKAEAHGKTEGHGKAETHGKAEAKEEAVDVKVKADEAKDEKVKAKPDDGR